MSAIWLLTLPLPLWVLYLAYIALKSCWNELRTEVKVVGAVVIVVGFIIDIAVNWTLGLVLGVTKDYTLSQKCSRLKRGTGWRARFSCYLCSTWLDPFELGGHCKD